MFLGTNSCCMIILIRSFREVPDLIDIHMNIILLLYGHLPHELCLPRLEKGMKYVGMYVIWTWFQKHNVLYMLFPCFVWHSVVNSSNAFVFYQQYNSVPVLTNCCDTWTYGRTISWFRFSHVLFLFLYIVWVCDLIQ